MTRHAARTLIAAPLIVALSIGMLACSSAGQSSSPSLETASATASPSGSGLTGSASPSVPPSGGAVSVSFVTPVPEATWGATFVVKAEATDGSDITYSAEGSCSIDTTTGKAKADALGSCTIIADAPETSPLASASQVFEVTKAHPVIKFSDASTRFARPFKFPLKVRSTPTIPLTIVVDHGAAGGNNDEFCAIDANGALVFKPVPTADDFPQIPATCVVKVTGTATENYDAPESVSRKIRIGLAAFDVNAQEVINVDLSSDGDVVDFRVRENSGDAFGIFVSSEDFECDVLPTTPDPGPAGTKLYMGHVKLQATGVPYDCRMTAQAAPPDYQGGKFKDDFVIHVVP
jgi:hypothetical protein